MKRIKRFKVLALLLSIANIATSLPTQCVITTYAEGKRHHWTAEEDEKLKILFKNFGNKWGKISKNIPGTTAAQCKDRYSRYLDPRLVESPFTEAHDIDLINLVARFGGQWKHFSEENFEGKSATMLKDRYHFLMKKQRDYMSNIFYFPCDDDNFIFFN